MQTDFYCFGEMLWDCLPSGRHAGGAPFNVAAHLAQLGGSVRLLSSVGQDALGEEILQIAREKGMDVELVTRARLGLPTGTVLVTVDAQGNASYELVQPVAWDEIEVADPTLEDLAHAKALLFGSLAGRSPSNLNQLQRLLAVEGPLRFFDVNLRPPFADPALVLDLARSADVLKLNDDELGRLASWLQTGDFTPHLPDSLEAVAAACAVVAEATYTGRICVTRGSKGAALWESGRLVTAPAPAVAVQDTVGAGDAFMAGLMCGLTRGMELEAVLVNACRIGAFVASHHGATPSLPVELQNLFALGSPEGVA